MYFKVKDFYYFLDKLAPLTLADPQDNNGLQIGSFDAEVSGVLLAVNPTLTALKEAKKEKLNLLITHHPLFYKSCSYIIQDRYPGNIIYYAVKNDLNILSWHTPLDKVLFGVSEALAKELFFETEDFILKEEEKAGFGKVVFFKNYVKIADLAKKIKERLNTWVMLIGDPEEKVNKIGVCGGAGGFLKDYLLKRGINTLLTSDVKYHQAIEAKESGFNFLLIDHGVGETFILKVLKEKIENLLEEKKAVLRLKIFEEKSPYMIF